MSELTDPALLEYIHGINERLRALEVHAERVGRQLGVPFGDPAATPAGDLGGPAAGGLATPATVAPGAPEEVVALARGGNKIAAIKRYRELTGADLREAKDAVDRI